MRAPTDDELRELPAWSLPASGRRSIAVAHDWPSPLTREWAWGDATGEGTRVCVLDSGIERGHPLVGALERSVSVEAGEEVVIEEDEADDLSGHGTACAGIIRALAPDCSIASVRVLGADVNGLGAVLLAGLEWALEEGYDVINLSLSTRRSELAWPLHELTARAYFERAVIVASAHNLPVESFPWRFPSVISVGSHDKSEPEAFYANPHPPAEFFARGVDLEVAWLGGRTTRATGNSFAAPHMTGLCARILSKHPELTPFQVKTVLSLIATNASVAT